jgi:hypothetical protein
MSESLFSGLLGYPGLAVVKELSSDDAKLYWLLLLMVLYLFSSCHLIIYGATTFFILVLFQVSCDACGHGYRRPPVRPSDSSVFRGTDKLLFCCPVSNSSPGRSSVCSVFSGADKLVICFPVFIRPLGRLSDCWFFRTAVKLCPCVYLFSW